MKTNLTKLLFSFILTLSPLTWASEPSGTPILRIETGMHTAAIKRISVDAKEHFLLTASDDKTLRLWDLNDGKQKEPVYRVPIGAGNEGVLDAGAISPDGELVAGGGWTGFSWEQGGSIYLFNRRTGRLIKRLYGLPEVILHLCFSPDGQYLAASLLGGFGIRVWETHRWEQVFSDTQYGDRSFSCQFDSKNRLLTTSYDGYLRLYSLMGDNFVLTTKTQLPGGERPYHAIFSPSGNKIAVGFDDSAKINVLDGQTLTLSYAPDTSEINNGNLISVAWSPDEQRLCAGGTYLEQPGSTPIRCWSQGGQGSYTDWRAATDTIMDILFLKNGDLVYGALGPRWGILNSTGEKRQEHITAIVDYRIKPEDFRVSYDGGTVETGSDSSLSAPDTTSLNITDWKYTTQPKLNGIVLPLNQDETSRSLAIAPDKSNFLLGADWYLRRFDANGQIQWAVPVPGTAWAVNLSGDGQKAIAALGDGTIRWYNFNNGEELLAWFYHNDGKRWINWTPSGYYNSSGEDADNLLGWHVNHGRDQEASFYLVGQKYSQTYKNPKVVQRTFVVGEKKALEELQEAENMPNEPSTNPILRIEAEMHTARINRFDVYESVTENLLVTASNDKTLRLWELTAGKLLNIYRVPIETGNEGMLWSTAISPDGQWIATAGATGIAWEEKYSVYVFSHATGQLVKRLAGLPEAVYHLCYSPDGQYLAASLEKGLRVWEAKQWQQVFSDTEYEGTSYSCQFDSKNRLLTTSFDGYLRLYSPISTGNFALLKKTQPPGEKQPFLAVFSPKGDKIAVGFYDTTQVNVLDGQTLDLLYSPDTNNLDPSEHLFSVAWSPDAQQLCAGGSHSDKNGHWLIRCWSQGGQGISTDWFASSGTIAQIRFLKNGDLVYGATDPSWGILDSAGQKKQEHVAPIADYRTRSINKLPEQDTDILWVSYDGSVVQFGFEQGGSRPARFAIKQQLLLLYPSPDFSLQLPDTTSLNITDWRNNPHTNPKLNGTVLTLESNETPRSLAIAPAKSTFLLGTEYALRLYDATGRLLWKIPIPSAAWAVNISGDGQKAIAALGDGTIRWYNLATGEELLAFFPHTDGKRWIAWTPSGYYMSSGENADKLLGWHRNQGKDQAAEFRPVSKLQEEKEEANQRKRPDVVKKVLDTLTEDKAVLVANLEKGIDATPYKTPNQLWADEDERYQVISTPSGRGKAIIVAASGEQQDNPLFPYTNQSTQAMYNLLHDRGFSDGDIVYLNPFPPIVPLNGYADIRRQYSDLHTNPLQQLTDAFNKVITDGLMPNQQFIFYLHGHAPHSGEIQLGRDESLSVTQLKTLLETLPKDVLQIIILDTCYSGAFLKELAGVPNRIVVTSADSDSVAWSSDNGLSFADKFLRGLAEGGPIYEAFDGAKQMIKDNPQTFCVQIPNGEKICQSPQLDDNQDGRLANGTILGNKVPASLLSLPRITAVHPAIHLDPQETTATLWVKTSVDMNTVNKVQAILTNENDKPTEYQGEQTQFTRREITLTPNYELQRFETDYNGFQAAKEWRIFYQVETIAGQRSDFTAGDVRTGGGASAVTVEAIMNKPTYQLGDLFSFDVMVAGEGNFDLYVGFIFPDGSYYTIASPFVFSEKNKLLPYQKNLQLAGSQTFTILSLGPGLLPALVSGEYQACGLLTKAQSDPENQTNWVKLDCQAFRF